jgi:hypothetical protein
MAATDWYRLAFFAGFHQARVKMNRVALFLVAMGFGLSRDVLHATRMAQEPGKEAENCGLTPP